MRPYFKSPTKVIVRPFTVPSSSRMVKRSRNACVGCSREPLPALMMGMFEKRVAMSIDSSAGWRRTMASP